MTYANRWAAALVAACAALGAILGAGIAGRRG